MKYLLPFVLLFNLLFNLSCGRSDDEKILDAVDEANLLLSDRKCDQAIQVLTAVGIQNNNKKYLDSLATAYACKGNYSTTTFFASDLTSVSGVSVTSAFGAFAAFSSSGDMTEATDEDFTNVQQAIDVLLHAGGHETSSAALRATSFSVREATDLNLQALYMILVNMGRWFRFYGNTNTSGAKGDGSYGNECIVTYTDGTAITIIDAGSNGDCDSAQTGHPSIETAERTERMCQGIVLYNNFVDTLSNIEFTGTDADAFNNLDTLFSTVCTTAAAAVPFSSTLCSARDASVCEAEANSDIERFFAAIFEIGLL